MVHCSRCAPFSCICRLRLPHVARCLRCRVLPRFVTTRCRGRPLRCVYRFTRLFWCILILHVHVYARVARHTHVRFCLVHLPRFCAFYAFCDLVATFAFVADRCGPFLMGALRVCRSEYLVWNIRFDSRCRTFVAAVAFCVAFRTLLPPRCTVALRFGVRYLEGTVAFAFVLRIYLGGMVCVCVYVYRLRSRSSSRDDRCRCVVAFACCALLRCVAPRWVSVAVAYIRCRCVGYGLRLRYAFAHVWIARISPSTQFCAAVAVWILPHCYRCLRVGSVTLPIRTRSAARSLRCGCRVAGSFACARICGSWMDCGYRTVRATTALVDHAHLRCRSVAALDCVATFCLVYVRCLPRAFHVLHVTCRSAAPAVPAVGLPHTTLPDAGSLLPHVHTRS